eukprot:g31180.t1
MGEISCVVVQWLSARLVKLIKIHLGFKCVEGVGHACKFPGQVVHCGGSRTNKRYPSIFLHSLSMAVGGGVVVLPGAGVHISTDPRLRPPCVQIPWPGGPLRWVADEQTVVVFLVSLDLPAFVVDGVPGSTFLLIPACNIDGLYNKPVSKPYSF